MTTNQELIVTTTPASEYSEATATITVFLSSGPATVDARGSRKVFGTIAGPAVCWAGMGAHTPADAIAYAAAIVRAAEVAATLDGPSA